MRPPLSRICTCGICDRQELTKQAILPDGWIITWEHTTTICDKCLARWVEKWDIEPIAYMKGGEKELQLL